MVETIKKRLKKKDKSITPNEAEEKAKEIWKIHCEVNEERVEKREREYKEEWDRLLQKDNDSIAFECLSGYELVNFSTKIINDYQTQ